MKDISKPNRLEEYNKGFFAGKKHGIYVTKMKIKAIFNACGNLQAIEDMESWERLEKRIGELEDEPGSFK